MSSRRDPRSSAIAQLAALWRTSIELVLGLFARRWSRAPLALATAGTTRLLSSRSSTVDPLFVPSGASASESSTPPPVAPVAPAARSFAITGSLWTVTGYGAGQVIRLASNLVLTWLLFKEAFGQMVLVNIVLQGATMFSDIGIGPSIIQHRRGDDPVFLDTAWSIQVVRGLCLWLACALIAPAAALFYSDPQLSWLIPVAGISAAISGLNSTKIFSVNRHMMLGRRTLIELASQIVGAVAMVVWALIDRSVWALVAGGIANSLCKMVLSHVALPGRVNRWRFDPRARRELLTFGKWVFVSTLITFFVLQIDRLVLGKLIPSGELGVYGIAMSIASLPTLVAGMIASSVAYPLLATQSRDDPGALAATTHSVRRYVLPVGLFALVAVALASPAFFHLLYDKPYHEAAWIAPALTVPFWFSMLTIASDRTLLAIGDARTLAISNAVGLAFKVLGCFLGFHFGGLLGFILGLTLGTLAAHVVVEIALDRIGIPIWSGDVKCTLALIGGVLLSAALWYGGQRLVGAQHGLWIEIAVPLVVLVPASFAVYRRLRAGIGAR